MRNTIEGEVDAKRQETEINFYFTAFPGSSLELALYPIHLNMSIHYIKDLGILLFGHCRLILVHRFKKQIIQCYDIYIRISSMSHL